MVMHTLMHTSISDHTATAEDRYPEEDSSDASAFQLYSIQDRVEHFTSVNFKSAAPIDNAAVHTCLDKDVWKLHSALR